MKNLLLFFLLITGFSSNAQLFVKPTTNNASYIFVNDTFIYVEEDIELETNHITSLTNNEFSSIILRGQGQLLQNNDAETNSGNGDISIYQEGTVNNFDYNFWASPVGLPVTDAGADAGSGNGQFSFRPGTATAGTATFQLSVFNSPLTVGTSLPAAQDSGLNGSSANGSNLRIASYWLFSFNASSAGYIDWVQVGDTGQLNAGYGFTMKGVSGSDNTTIATETAVNNAGNAQRYDFRGRPNNGTITGVTVGLDEAILVGNPYPSAMDLSYFLLENSANLGQDGVTATYDLGPETNANTTSVSITRRRVTTGIAYFWESDPSVNSHNITDYQGGYGTFSPMGVLGGTGIYVPATYFNYDGLGNETTDTGNEGNAYARRFSPVGQGFFLQGVDSNQGTQVITFSNRHRVYVPEGAANNSEFRTAVQNDEPVAGIGVDTYYPDVTNMMTFSQIYLAVGINDLYSRQLAIGLMDSATEEFDFGIDAPVNGALATDAAFASEYTDNIDVLGNVIAGVPKDEYQWIPLKLQVAETSELRFKVYKIEEFEYDNVFLFDNLTNVYHDILNKETTLELDEGVYTDRFYVRFTKEEESTEEEDESTEEEEEEEGEEDEETLSIDDTFTLESFTVFQNNNANQLEIYNPENIILKDLALFDLGGKMIFQEADLGDQNEFFFSTSNLSTGIYVLQFTTRDGLIKGQKISITN